LYFGIECFDSAPEGIIATELRRDTDFTVDDYFSILISPNNDGVTRMSSPSIRWVRSLIRRWQMRAA